MIFSRINLKDALVKERSNQRKLIDEANEILKTSARKDADVAARLKGQADRENKLVVLNDLDDVFSIDEIRNICIKYRLRFLDTSFFRPEFPYEAILKIKRFEERNQKKISSFSIIAPAEAFELENINKDPILFAKLNEQSYYLIHQWGHELSWFRKIVAWPVRNFRNLIITLASICFLFAFGLPASIMNIFSFQSEIYLRIWLTVHTFIGLLGLTLWAGLAFDKTFSSMNWNSKYYNY